MLINAGFRNFPFQLLEGKNSRLGYRDPERHYGHVSPEIDEINLGIFGIDN